MKTVNGIEHYENCEEASFYKHGIGDVWYVKVAWAEGKHWYVQFPNCRDAFKTKELALKWAEAIKRV